MIGFDVAQLQGKINPGFTQLKGIRKKRECRGKGENSTQRDGGGQACL
jgi:hypothetical protein